MILYMPQVSYICSRFWLPARSGSRSQCAANGHESSPTTHPIVDPVTVAPIEFGGGAKSPNGLLQESGKVLWKLQAKLPSVELEGEVLDYFRTTARPVAARTVRVRLSPPCQTALKIDPLSASNIDPLMAVS